LYTETHTKITNSYGLVNLVIGSEIPDYGVFSDINWAVNDKFIQVQIDEGSGLTNMGTFQLLTVPFAMHAASATNLGSENVYTGTDTLFVVKDAEGNPVFVVFPDGAKVIVDEATKGTVGGFAVSGRSPTKTEETEIFIVTPDSTRIYVNDTVQSKGTVGGFAVSGRSPTKRLKSDYLVITPDSTRIYVNDSTLSKGRVGGFAVSGRSPTKNGSIKFMDMTKENYFIGHKSGINNVTGSRNIFLGYESGLNNSGGTNNILLGYQSGYNLFNGGFNILMGYKSGYTLQNSSDNIFIGFESGYNSISSGNMFLGFRSGYSSTSGNFNIFVGTNTAYWNTTGAKNTYIGYTCGVKNTTGSQNTFFGFESGVKNETGADNIFIGKGSGYDNISGISNVYLGSNSGQMVNGSGNIFIGYLAGSQSSSSVINNRLIIQNNTGIVPPLIYGEFDNERLIIAGNSADNVEGRTFFVNGSAGGILAWSTDSDHRLKHDINPISGGLEKVMQLTGVTYFWNDQKRPQSRQVGFIAQDVDKVLPEVVSNINDHYSMQYAPITALLVEAIKEQQKEISELKARLTEIEKLLLKK
jgi:Chaperone of endosialidase